MRTCERKAQPSAKGREGKPEVTNQELDEARGREAYRRAVGDRVGREIGHNFNLAAEAGITGARLGREGWMPVQPLLQQARDIVAQVLADADEPVSAEAARKGMFDDLQSAGEP